jgi:hypothetical protein
LPCLYPLPWKLTINLTNKLLIIRKRESVERSEKLNVISNGAVQRLAFMLHLLEALGSNFSLDAT